MQPVGRLSILPDNDHAQEDKQLVLPLKLERVNPGTKSLKELTVSNAHEPANMFRHSHGTHLEITNASDNAIFTTWWAVNTGLIRSMRLFGILQREIP